MRWKQSIRHGMPIILATVGLYWWIESLGRMRLRWLKVPEHVLEPVFGIPLLLALLITCGTGRDIPMPWKRVALAVQAYLLVMFEWDCGGWRWPGPESEISIVARWLGWIVGYVAVGSLFANFASGSLTRRVPDYPICRRCTYNLTGNVSGICPECGSAIEGKVRSTLIAETAQSEPRP